MIRRAFIKRFSAGVLGCGMLAEALLSKGPTMAVALTDAPVVTANSISGDRRIDLGPRVRDRKDMEHRFEARADNPRQHRQVRRGVLYVNGLADYG
jgi:hypothetical protein